MRHYASFGIKDFVVACGYKGYVIKEYFANYLTHECDLSIDLGTGAVEVLSQHPEDWRVTLVDTGQSTMTGGRLARLAPLLGETFLLTYGDGLSDVSIDELLAFHRSRGALATVTAVHQPPRFGALEIGRRHGHALPREAADLAGPHQRRLLRLRARACSRC